jgi:DNA-binding NarL/FixJ family response regulator
MKAILADDHALFREGFALLLKQMQAGSEVAMAADLDDCLMQIQHQPDADLLLLDLNMPGMHGQDSVKALMRAHPDLPVVILSAAECREEVMALLSGGVAGYIPKSASPQVMISALRLILAGGVYVPPQFLDFDVPARTAEPGARSGHAALTERQMDVLRLISDGKPNKQICRELGLGEGTVKAHLAAIFRALDVRNRTEAAGAARRLGIIG